MSCSEFLLKNFRVVVYCSVIKVLCVVVYDSFNRLSHLSSLVNNFFIFVVSAVCTRSKQLIQNIMFIDICQQLFSFHIFRIFGCVSWTAVLLSPVSRESLYNIAQQSHHCQQLFHLFSFLSTFTHLSTLHCEYTIFKACFFH